METGPAAGRRPAPRPPRLVLLHGTRMSRAQWEPYRALLPGVEIVSVDLPGHGERVGEEFTRAAALATVGEAVDRAGERPVLAGHSLGGYLAAMWAAEHPDRLGALVLIGATADPAGPLTALYRGFARALPHLDADRTARRVNALMRLLGARGEHAEALPDGTAYASLPAAWDLVIAEAGPRLLEDVRCPVVLVNGQLDQMRLHARRFAAHAQDPHVLTIPRATHLMPATHPEQLASALRQALVLARPADAGPVPGWEGGHAAVADGARRRGSTMAERTRYAGFDGRVALVTGGGSGIGRACSEDLARQGARVVVTDIDLQAAQAVAEGIVAAGGQALALQHDTTSPEAGEAAVARAVETFGGLHYAVNNAGISGSLDVAGEIALEDWLRVIEVNLNGVLYGLRHQLPAIEASGGGAVVNMASIHGTVATGLGAPAYTASKHGVVGLTKQTAVDYAKRGVRVNAVGPAYIDTPLLAGLDDQVRQALVAAHPLGRLGRAEEVAALTTFLLSDDASFITGSYHLVDGGYTAP